jgi:hypothetical protein
MSLANGSNFITVIAVFLNNLGYIIPDNQVYPDSPALLTAWQGWASRNQININDWPRPALQALNMAQTIALDTIYQTFPAFVAADALLIAQNNQRSVNASRRQVHDTLERQVRFETVYKHVKRKMDRATRNVPAPVAIQDFIDHADKEKINRESKRVLKLRLAALSNDPKP